MEFEKRKKPYKIPDNAITFCAYRFFVCGFLMDDVPNEIPMVFTFHWIHFGFSQVVLVVKKLPANAGDIRDTSSIPGSGKSPRGGHGNPLQYSCLENPMDRGAW